MQPYRRHLPVQREYRQSDRDSGCLVKRHEERKKKVESRKKEKFTRPIVFIVGQYIRTPGKVIGLCILLHLWKCNATRDIGMSKLRMEYVYE